MCRPTRTACFDYEPDYSGAEQGIFTGHPLRCQPSLSALPLLYSHSSTPCSWIIRSTLALGEGRQHGGEQTLPS